MNARQQFPNLATYTSGNPPKCKRCGSTHVVWEKSKTGKFYLCEVFTVDGEPRYNYRTFHSQYCGKPELHKDRQTEIDHEAEQHERKTVELRGEQEERRNVESGMRLLALFRLSDDEKRGELARLEREHERYLRYPPTMDYMVEFNREVAEAKERTALINYIKGLLGEGDPEA